MTKDDFLIELNEFQYGLQYFLDKNNFDWYNHYEEGDLSILPVKAIRLINRDGTKYHPVQFVVKPATFALISFEIDSKPIHDLYDIHSTINNWHERDSYAFEFAQGWNKTVFDIITETKTDLYKTAIKIFNLFFDKHLIKIGDYKSFIDETVIKKDKRHALYIIADEMRQQVEEGKFTTYRQAYEFAAKHYKSFGKSFTSKSLESAYIREKDRGRIG